MAEHLAEHRHRLGHQLRHEPLPPRLAVVCACRVGHERRPEHVPHDLLGHALPHRGADRSQQSAAAHRPPEYPDLPQIRAGDASRAEPDQDQRADAIGVASRQTDADEPADRCPDPVAPVDAQLVDQRDRVVVEPFGPQQVP